MSAALADITVVMPTVDRSPQNYLLDTFVNLARGGVFKSLRLKTFLISDGSDLGEPRSAMTAHFLQIPKTTVCAAGARLSPCENAGRALFLGALTSAPWVLYLEDDIDVCADFVDGVGAWLDDHAGGPDSPYRVFAFGAAYTPQIEAEIARGSSAWEYPVRAFYGTQAIALRAQDAQSLGTHWQSSPTVRGVPAPGQYDLMLQDWLRARYVDGRILAACPSMVALLGVKSSIRVGDSAPPRFDSWRGRDWRYVSPRTQRYSL